MTNHARALAVLLAALSTAAVAAPRTMIGDYTGLNCAVNSAGGALRAKPDVKARQLKTLADLTQVHILGGKQFGKFVAFPNTDAEFARTWLKIKAKGVPAGWMQSGSINCGG